MSHTQSHSGTQSNPERWLLDNLPHMTVAGVQLAHVDTGSGHSTQFYSIEWLAEEFGEIITTADHPKQKLLTVGAEHGPSELKRLFEQLEERSPGHGAPVSSD